MDVPRSVLQQIKAVGGDVNCPAGSLTMKDIPGTPGTLGSLLLRIGQFGFALGSLVMMATSPHFSSFTAFCYLVAAMGMQCLWSFVMAILDSYALLIRRGLRSPSIVSLFAVGDWVAATLSFAASCATAGLAVLFEHDLQWCGRTKCVKYQVATSLAFASCILVTCSFLLIFWFLATE
eukprot:c21189_g1_i1 orf=383-916(-)